MILLKVLISALKLIVLFFFFNNTQAQSVLSNKGGLIHTDANAIIHVQGSVQSENNGTNEGRFDHQGTLNLTGDWINNNDDESSILAGSEGNVVLIHDGLQLIDGTQPTIFGSLTLAGGYNEKHLMTDAEVTGVLDLNNSELQTFDNSIIVSNPLPEAIIWDSGYVASNTLGGYLFRSTNDVKSYSFPVGSINLDPVYRPVVITPDALDSNMFGVRLADIDPSLDDIGIGFTDVEGPFVRSTKVGIIEEINDQYYHNIVKVFGSANPTIQLYYFSQDGDFSRAGTWKFDDNKWDILTAFTEENTENLPEFQDPDMQVIFNDYANFENEVVALINENDDVFSQLITPNGDGLNESFHVKDAELYPENELKIYNRWGNLIFEQIGYLNDWDAKAHNGLVINFGSAVQGDKVPSGVYFFDFKYNADDQESLTGYFHVQY